MNKLKLSFLLLSLLLIISTLTFSNENKSIENFVIYSAQGVRCLFLDIVASVPGNGFLIVNFTSVNCKPCRKEIPELRELTVKYRAYTNLMCVYIEVGKPVQELSKSLGVFNYAFVDPFGKMQKLFKVKSVPVTFLINKKNIIVCRFDGYSQENIKALEAVLKENKK